MNAHTTDPQFSAPLAGASTTTLRWAALVDAGNALALLAGTRDNAPDMPAGEFAALLAGCPAWQRRLADNAVADLAAIMESGLTALLAGHQRGADTRPAAMALWREYIAARGGVLDLVAASEKAQLPLSA